MATISRPVRNNAKPHYLDEPLVLEILALERVRDHLRPLARDEHSALPPRLRNRCAKAYVDLTAVLREIQRRPEAILEERFGETARGGTKARGLR